MANHKSASTRRVLVAALACLWLTTATTTAQAQSNQRTAGVECRPAGSLVTVAGLREASGAAASRRYPGSVWTHNDSGAPTIFLVDERGAVTRQVQLPGVDVTDWEAISIGKCPSGSCLFVGDIGDNNANRQRISVYRIPEPAEGAKTAAAAEVFHATYPDGPHDAETLLVTPTGEMVVVTKGETGPLGAYRFPRDAKPGSTVSLQPIGTRNGKVDSEERVTDGAVSPNGAWVVLRTSDALQFYPAAEFLAGRWASPRRAAIGQLGEPQGEGIAFADSRTLVLVGEGGGKVNGGTIARLTCELPAK